MDDCFGIVRSQLKGLRPSFLAKKPHFNFITVHYFYIFGLTILGSILIYGPGKGNLAYIDALTFAAGGATQAGLNTVNVNNLNTFQQAVLYVIAGICNPITINSFVVVLRLYWFEKRFQNIVQEARLRRGTLSKSKAKAADEASRLERGVNGRNITVMHNGARSRLANDGTYLGPLAAAATDTQVPRGDATTGANGAAEATRTNGAVSRKDDMVDPKFTFSEPLETRKPEITFAPTVKRSDGLGDDVTKLPPRLTNEEHIAILERQRNQNDDEVLHIPGPRDAERGVLPSRVVRGEESPGSPGSPRERQFSAASMNSEELQQLPESALNGTSGRKEEQNPDDDHSGEEVRGRQRLGQAITIQEPEKPSRVDELNTDVQAVAGLFNSFRPRKPRLFDSKNKRYHDGGHDADENDHTLQKTTTTRSKIRHHPLHTLRTAFSRDKDEDPAPYLSWEPTLGRNSAFLDLTEEQREELGGIEYRSLKTLALVLLAYYWGFWLLGIVSFVPWILRSSYGSVVDQVSQNRVWWGFWTPHSAFMDLGFTLTPDSMNSFNTAVFPMLFMSFLIVIGNTGFPVMLRFVIWVMSLIVPRSSGIYEELRFLLDHPRRCFTLLFPSGATWWLFWLLVALNGIDLLFFCILDLGSGPVSALPAGVRILDGLFQAFSTRTAGFSCINLANLHPAVQTSYMIMMYISVFPIAISVRRTNVYEEKSLGVYDRHEQDESANGTDLEYVGAHLRRQLSFDLWYLSIGVLILAITEGGSLQAGAFDMFAVIFEIVSAYGTVGLSLGYSGGDESLCSQFSVLGKLVIIAMMIRGRHRGLPYGLDRAILLPSESLNAKEDAAAEIDALARAGGPLMSSAGNQASTVPVGNRPPTTRAPSTSTNRDRRRSRSIDRVNSNLITQFLHPGPVLHGNSLSLAPPAPRRSFSEAAIDANQAHTTGFEAPGQAGKLDQ